MFVYEPVIYPPILCADFAVETGVVCHDLCCGLLTYGGGAA
jgi:hypothetical protein